MRFESDGMALWFGTADAPAPSGSLSAGQGITAPLTVTIAVQPPSVSNTVQLLYRVNSGSTVTIAAALKRQDLVAKAQYFAAQLPTFRSGDTVEYSAVARSPGRQVPTQPTLANFAASFMLGGAAAAPAAAAAHTNPPPAPRGPKAPPATGTIAGKGPFKVLGYLFYEHGLPAAGIAMRLYARTFGGLATKLGEIVTDVNGWYGIAYDVKAPPAHLELRAVDSAGKEMTLCDSKPALGLIERWNLVAPDSLWPVDAELARISADVGAAAGGLAKLADSREDEEQKDLTILASATQWDARLIGLLAASQKIAKDAHLAADLVYALLRAGLPAERVHLARAQASQVDGALMAAVGADIVRMNAQQMIAAKQAFQQFSMSVLRAANTPGGVSSYDELLRTSGLSPAQQSAFAELYFSHVGEPADFWNKAASLGIPKDKIEFLKLQGCLFQLTLNNARLTEALQHEIGSLANLAKLVDADLHQGAAWKGRLQKLAGNNEKALAALIPTSYGSQQVEERLEAYSADLARRVRMSYPAHVTARMLESGVYSIPGQETAERASLAKFLKRAADLGYRMGETPVEVFLTRHKDLTAGLSETELANIKGYLKHLHRLHQVTPSDESLQILLGLGLKSAHEIARIPSDAFLHLFEAKFPAGEAALIYRRAEQVHSTTFGVAAMAQKASTTSAGFALAAPPAQRQSSQSRLIEQFPTMSSLFGSLDFCECEECRSVLGPAAYLVDILQMLDRGKSDWAQFLENWTSEHYGTSYPYRDASEQRAHTGQGATRDAGSPKTPYEILIQRRPDLPHLPLTCENTNTVMPYIDIVNEILEYFVAHDSLATTSGHDTGKARSDELLAEPQNMLPAAYDKLGGAWYPLSLPFDLGHEMSRRLLEHVDTSLAEVLEIFRPTEGLLTDLKNPTQYGYAEVFRETLGLSPAEFALFSDPALGAQWFKLYGYQSEPQALKELASAKVLADRLDVSYMELASVITTGFVNPALDSMGLLYSLGVEIDELIATEARGASAGARQAFEERLVRLGARFALTSGQIRNWLADLRQRGEIGRLLYFDVPGDGSCDFGATRFKQVNGEAADPSSLLRLNIFVRLWRRLGWSLETLDSSLTTLLPASAAPLTTTSAHAALPSVLMYLSHLHWLRHRLTLPERGIRQLLPLWKDLPTTGRRSLYAEFFLRPSILKADAVFDDPFGNYLQDGAEPAAAHFSTIQAALGLTARDIEAVLTDAGLDPQTATLSLQTVSMLYRYGFLAKALKIPVAELIVLKALSGTNPFSALGPAPMTGIADDAPYATMHFVQMVEAVKASGFTNDDIDYLFNHQFDPVGKYRDDPLKFLELVKSLAAGVRAIQLAHAMPSDPGAITAEVLQQNVALAMASADAATFMGLWNGTGRLQVSMPGILPGAALDPKAFSAFPEVNVSYDAVTQSQVLTLMGGLTTKRAAELQAANASALFSGLIAKALATQQAFFDRALSPFLSADDIQLILPVTTAGRTAALAAKLYPYIQQQLSYQLVTQTLASSLGADESVLQAFILHPTMLADPVQPGVALAATFVQVAQNQLDNMSSVPLAGGTEIHWQGYVEVPATGPYRFFAGADKSGANLRLQIDASPDPVLSGALSNDGGEVDGLIELKAGALYALAFDATNLAGGGAQLMVQGESLPKDLITRLSLYSKVALDRASRARDLLIKSLLLIEKFLLCEREWRYLLVEPTATSGSGLNLCQLPADLSDVTPGGAQALFGRFLNLATYVRLRNDMAGGSSDLIDLFVNAQRQASVSTHTPPDLAGDLAARIATLTRREKKAVSGVMQQLAMSAVSIPGPPPALVVPALRSAVGLEKLWQVLRLLERFGVGAGTLAGWATAAPDITIAEGIRNALKAHYGAEKWLMVAPSIFDKLRRRQRDALVAFIMHRNGFASRDQLFEYFLVDPGMEPVVQTSRLRLAISCVQTFIQRCLLNLESAVQPAAINADQWLWMKRYRVWQACREIFLHPENYMEMEFRDDKTELFQELEGTLLQGDITDDLASDALFNYLKKLEGIANLEVMTLCAEENPLDPQSTKLHVIARTRITPASYYYRRYVDGMWTPWESIGTNLAGDHIVAVIWQHRLNVFWVSFINQAKTDAQSGNDDGAGSGDETKLSDVKLSDMKRQSAAGLPPKVVQVQLNWAEYYQGAWSTPATTSGSDDSGDGDSGSDAPPPGSVGTPVTVIVDADFDPSEVGIFATVDEQSDPQTACISVSFPEVQVAPAYHHVTDAKRRRTVSHPVKARHGTVIVEHAVEAPRPQYRPKTFTFRVMSKYAAPVFVAGTAQEPPPFPGVSASTTHFLGSRAFQVQYVESIQSVDGATPTVTLSRQSILKEGGRGAGTAHALTVLGDPLKAQHPEIGALVSPLFYTDDRNSFFIEPTLTEVTIDKWEHWAVPVPRTDAHGEGRGPSIVAAFPKYQAPRSLPKGVLPFNGLFDPACRFKVKVESDSVTDIASVLHFGGFQVGNQGGVGVSRPRTAQPPAASVHRGSAK